MPILEFALNLIYPKVCGMCEKHDTNSLCQACEQEINKIVINKIDRYKTSQKYFNTHMYIFRYTNPIRQKIIDYKFNDKPYLCEFFVKCILKNEKICKTIRTYDIIIPVPIHKKRYKERGYNQSKLIAKKLAKELNLQVDCNCLHKNENNIEQSRLNKLERTQNVKNVYEIGNMEKIKDKNIIIFDDIYTTGSTVNECSKMLKEAGANKIAVLTIAKD